MIRTKRITIPGLAVVVASACSEPTAPARDVSQARLSPNDPRSSVLVSVTAGHGPFDCVRDRGAPDSASFTFAATPGQAATLLVIDNGVQGLNGTIELNGETVVSHPMFGGNGPVNLAVPVTLAASNTLVCKLEGKPGSGLRMTVK